MFLTFAHAGHWTAQLIYVAPIAVLGVGLLVSWLKDRRATRTQPRSLNR